MATFNIALRLWTLKYSTKVFPGGSGKRSLPMVCPFAIGKPRRLRLPLPPSTMNCLSESQ